jgi:hypothetical protein
MATHNLYSKALHIVKEFLTIQTPMVIHIEPPVATYEITVIPCLVFKFIHIHFTMTMVINLFRGL